MTGRDLQSGSFKVYVRSRQSVRNIRKLGDSLPVTVGFSDAVGEILIANPGVKAMSASFRYYI